MSEATKPLEKKYVYRVDGFSCANCAGKFERNVKNSGSRGCKSKFWSIQNFRYGEATVEELEKAGAFENLKVAPENLDGRLRKRLKRQKYISC